MKKWERLSASPAAQKFVKILPIACFIFGCIWCTLFPFVSITTGEMKPRGFFVDEHAILSGGNPNKEVSYSERPNIETVASLDCSQFNHTLGQCCRTFRLQNRSITQVVVDSIYSPKSLESTVVILRSYTGATHSLLMNLVEHLSMSQWLANRVIFLVLTPQPTNQHLNSHHSYPSFHFVADDMSVVDSWLQEIYSGRRGVSPSFASSYAYGQKEVLCGGLGLIREAYIIDMSLITSEDNLQPYFAYDGLRLLSVGRNGATPNLDIISYPFDILQPPQLITESSASACQTLTKRVALLAATTKTKTKTLTSSMTPLVARMTLPVLTSVVGQYPKREGPLCALLSYATTTIAGPSGLHALFIERNIDSISFQLLPSSAGSSTSNRSKGKKQPDLLAFIYKLIFVSSNLHEELHHSLHSYLLIGNDSFVGVNEYGPALLLLLLSLLFIILKLTDVQFISNRDVELGGKTPTGNAEDKGDKTGVFIQNIEIGMETLASFLCDLLPLAFVIFIVYPSITIEYQHIHSDNHEEKRGDSAYWTFNEQLLAASPYEECDGVNSSCGVWTVICWSKYTILSIWKSLVVYALQAVPSNDVLTIHILLIGTAMTITICGIFFRCKRIINYDRIRNLERSSTAFSAVSADDDDDDTGDSARNTESTQAANEENKLAITTYLYCFSMAQYSSVIYCIVSIAVLLVILCWLCTSHPSLGLLCAVTSIPSMLFINYGLQSMLQLQQLTSAKEEANKSKNSKLMTALGCVCILVLFNPLVVHTISQIAMCDFGEACTSNGSTETSLPIAFFQSWLQHGSFSFPAIYATTYIVMCTATQLVAALLFLELE